MLSPLLHMSGAASMLGGDDAMSSMTTVYIYRNRRWLGWYNSPGTFKMATCLDSFAKSGCFYNVSNDTYSPRSNSIGMYMDPAALLGVDSCSRPKYRDAHSDTIIEQTCYLGALFMQECTSWDPGGRVIQGRRTQPVGVVIADLGLSSTIKGPTQGGTFTPFSAVVPIIFSITTSTLCALSNDWYAASLIFVGIIANGVACLVLGSADFVFTHPESVEGSPGSATSGGVLTSGEDIVVLRGTEGAVNSITHGRFYLFFTSERHCNLIRSCSVLFFIQAITQLFLIPQASLFGQVLFLISLIASALYNTSFSSSDKGHIFRRVLFNKVLENPALTRYTLGTRAAAVVFILLSLKPSDPTRLLYELVPEDTKVWKQWKATILEWLRNPNDSGQSFPLRGDLHRFTHQEKDLLELLYGDARAAYNGYTQLASVATDI